MSIDAHHVSTWYGKPPLKRLEIDLHVRNGTDRPRWLFVPRSVGTTSTGGVNGVTVYEMPGWLWEIEGSGGGWAVKLSPHSELTLQRLPISSWDPELPASVILSAALADDITIGGVPLTRFVGADRTTEGHHDARIDRMKTKVAAFAQTEKNPDGLPKEATLAFVRREDVPVTVSIGRNPGSWPQSFAGLLGRKISLEGTALESKEGPVLSQGDRQIWIETAGGWPSGRRVRVSGVVTERYDRPVFVEKAGEPVKAGVPVSEGTDLKKASHRFVIANATWTPID